MGVLRPGQGFASKPGTGKRPWPRVCSLAPCRLVLEAAAPSLYGAINLLLLELEPHLAALKTALGWEDTAQEGVCREALQGEV